MFTSMKQILRESRLVNTLGLSLMKICLGMNMLIKLKKKAAFSLYTLRKASPVVPRNIMCMLYNCILLPHFDYGDNIWGTCNVSSHHKVQKLQNRAAKIITGSARMDSSTEARNKLKWLNLKDRYQFHLAVNMFKVMNGQAPNYLANRFNIKDSGYALRGYKNLSIPKPRTEFKKDPSPTVVRHCGIPYQMQ